MDLLTDFVSLLLLLRSLMLDALTGIQLIMSVMLAPRIGLLMLMEYVCLLMISAELMMPVELALAAGKDMILLILPVSSHPQTLKDLRCLAA